jgi:hypothetical protein
MRKPAEAIFLCNRKFIAKMQTLSKSG